jgi:beta-lactamase superfamily II metal-dependent hydrolase
MADSSRYPTPVSCRTRRFFLQSATIGAASLSFAGVPEARRAGGAFTLWQLPPQTKTQMNCYVIETGAGVIVIDGGNAGDGPYLKGFLGALGDHVSHWFISHPHSDHLDAVTAILRDPGRLKVDAIHGSFPARDWIAKYEPDAETTLVSFSEVLREKGLPFHEHEPGETISFGALRFEILGIKNPEITANPINNSSVVMRMTGGGKTVLFTGDLGVEGGEKALKSRFRDKLRADWVRRWRITARMG